MNSLMDTHLVKFFFSTRILSSFIIFKYVVFIYEDTMVSPDDIEKFMNPEVTAEAQIVVSYKNTDVNKQQFLSYFKL